MARIITIFFILTTWLVTDTSSSPLKHTLTDQMATNGCPGTVCYYDPDYFDTKVDVKFPQNLTNSVLSALPQIEASQSEMVALQNKTFVSQEKMVSLLEQNEQSTSALPEIVASQSEMVALQKREVLLLERNMAHS